MKFVYILIFVLFITILTGCKSELTKNKINSEVLINSRSIVASSTATPIESPIFTPIETTSSNSFISGAENNTQGKVVIKVSYEKPISLKNKSTIFLDGVLKGDEYIEVIVRGKIFDFEQVELMSNQFENGLKEKATVKSIKKIENNTLIIKTKQSEWIPAEKIKWKSSSGKTYEYVIYDRLLEHIEDNTIEFEIN